LSCLSSQGVSSTEESPAGMKMRRIFKKGGKVVCFKSVENQSPLL